MVLLPEGLLRFSSGTYTASSFAMGAISSAGVGALVCSQHVVA